jgi:hypothetical protein
MKLWIDDLRKPTTDWQWAETSEQAIRMLNLYCRRDKRYDEISFDHDLGGDDTSRAVMLWMIEFDVWPATIHVHTMNPVGRDWLVGMAQRYAPDTTHVDIQTPTPT